MSYNIAIAGIENITGQEILSLLHENNFPVSTIQVACEDKNQLKQISFGDETLNMIHTDQLDLGKADILFLTGTPYVAAQLIEKAAAEETKIIDLTSSKGKILSAPTLGHITAKDSKIVASPCSSSLQLFESLRPLAELGKMERVVVSTYQSVSEIGRSAMDELFNQVRSIYMNQEAKPQHFKKQIAFNVLPQVGDFEDNHHTTAEDRILDEISSLFNNPPQLSVTCVQTPVFVGNAQSVTVQFAKDIAVKDAKEAWRKTENIEIIDLESEMEYVTPSEIHGEPQLFLSRIRQNTAMENSLSFWSVTDNLKNGEAANAVKIAETILNITAQG